MRILHILDHSLPLQSGYAFRTIGILTAQRALGWETHHLTTPKQTTAQQAVEEIDGWEFHRTAPARGALTSLPVGREIALMHVTTRRIDELVRRLRPDVLHAHSPVLNGIPALRVGRRHGVPVLYELRALWEDAAVDHGTANPWGIRYRASRLLETRVLKRANAITTICEGLKREIVARGLPAENVTVIPNAVNIEEFRGERQRQDALATRLGLDGAEVLGFIGSFYAYEGLDLLLRALPRVISERPNVKVLLVGGGPQAESLKELACALELGPAVVFAGRVAHSEVQAYYDLIDLLVYPRRAIRLTELVTPLKPLEAMARRRVVLASDVGGHRELITDGKTGYLFRAGNIDDLTRRVCDVLSRHQEWSMIRSNGYRFVETERNWTASVARYLPIFESLSETAVRC